MEELLKQILVKLDQGQLQIDELVKGQSRMEKLQKSMAKDMKVIKDYQHKRLDIDIEKLQGRVEIIETTLKIS